MIEAVNSVLSNAPVVRNVAEQQSAARSFAANPERVQEVARAPYVSPYIFVDNNFDRAVLQIRDSDTGDVVRQFPSESQLEAYRRAQAAQLSEPQSNRASEAREGAAGVERSTQPAPPPPAQAEQAVSPTAPASQSAPAQTTSVDTQV